MAARYGAVIYPVEFDDQSFAHYATLGGCLDSRTKRSASVTALILPRVGDVPVAVLAHCRIGSCSYPTRRDFSHGHRPELAQSGQSVDGVRQRAPRSSTVERLPGLSLTSHDLRTGASAPTMRHVVVVVAAAGLPTAGAKNSWITSRRARLLRAFCPCKRRSFANGNGASSTEHNRFSPEIEQRDLYLCLLFNAEPDDVIDKLERSLPTTSQSNDPVPFLSEVLEEQRTRRRPLSRDQS
jgi:hypothetical protein